MNKNAKKNAKSNTKSPSGRIKYGFELNFPNEPFTIRNLARNKKGKVKYITLYSRVKNALAEGLLVIAGEKTPQHKTRGRRQLIFQRVDAKTPVVNVTASVDAPVAV